MNPRRNARWIAPLSVRVECFGALFALAAVIYWAQAAYRTMEAFAASRVVTLLSSGPAYVNSGRGTFFVGLGHPDAFGLRVTTQCSTALLVAALLIVSAVAALLPGAPLRRLFMATALGSAALFGTNLVRLLTIAWSSDVWGVHTGFRWAHTYLGSWITIAGGVVAAATYVGYLGGSWGPLSRRRA